MALRAHWRQVRSRFCAVSSLDQPVGSQRNSVRNLQAERFSGFHIDDKIELRCLLDWQVAGLCTLDAPFARVLREGAEWRGNALAPSAKINLRRLFTRLPSSPARESIVES